MESSVRIKVAHASIIGFDSNEQYIVVKLYLNKAIITANRRSIFRFSELLAVESPSLRLKLIEDNLLLFFVQDPPLIARGSLEL